MAANDSLLTRRNLLSSLALPLASNNDVLVCIFQRGAADGLNSLVPYNDPDYASQRGPLAVSPPGTIGGAIDLDSFFGLHPALAPLKPIYDNGDLAFVHATGVPHGSRSHFTAQGLVEQGIPDRNTHIPGSPNSGWLGRHLAQSRARPDTAFRSVAISSNVPVTLNSEEPALAINQITDFGFDQEIIDSGYTAILENIYQSPAPFGAPARAALSAIDELNAAQLENITPDNGAIYPNTALGNKLSQAAKLIKSSLPVEVICLDSDGWDHHENLPVYLHQSLQELAGGLSNFYLDMGMQRMGSITVLVYTEFGRRVAANASNGVDHGTGGLAYLLGGGVNGGRITTDWPGLRNEDLALGEDLGITTDIRDVLTELLIKRLGGTDVATVFPGFTPSQTSLNLFSSKD